MSVVIRRLEQADLEAYRVVRLRALQQHPEAYAASYEDEVKEPLTSYGRRISAPPGATLGCFVGNDLVGIAGLRVETGIKVRHKGVIVGVYLDRAHRHHGLARQLMEAIIQCGRDAGLALLQLQVTVGNAPAERLYRSLGFEGFGVERRALWVNGAYVDEALMELRLE